MTEYIDGVTLREFIAEAFEHIAAKTLSHWSTAAASSLSCCSSWTVAWLHGVYKCCHLDLCLNDCVVHGVDFAEIEEAKHGKYRVSCSISRSWRTRPGAEWLPLDA